MIHIVSMFVVDDWGLTTSLYKETIQYRTSHAKVSQIYISDSSHRIHGAHSTTPQTKRSPQLSRLMLGCYNPPPLKKSHHEIT
jgi:hypothetical protein